MRKDRVKMEEIAGQQPLGLTARERAPRGVHLPGRRATAVGAQDPPPGGFTQLITQTEEFAVYSPISPPGILAREPGDHFTNLAVRRRAAWPVRVPPPACHQAPVPGQQRGRC